MDVLGKHLYGLYGKGEALNGNGPNLTGGVTFGAG